MQVTRNNISKTKVELTIILGLEELIHAKEHELRLQAKNMKVTGFRQGKAPLSIVEKKIDDNQLQASVINHAINDFYVKAVEQQNLRVLDQPEVSVGKFVPYTELEFVAKIEIMPEVKLGDYKKIKKTLPIATVTDKEIKEVIEDLRTRMAVKEDSAKTAKNGDDVIIDFAGNTKDGKPVAGASGKDYSLNLGSKSFIPGFEEGLIGVKTGENKKLKLQFPKKYHAKNLAGTDVTFDIKVKNIKTVVLPELDDAFAAQIGPFKTVNELKKDVKAQLLQQKMTDAMNKLKDEVVEELVKQSKFTLPEVLINDQVKMLENDFDQNLLYRGITRAEYLTQEGYKNEEDWKTKELLPQAERRVSVGMVLSEVAQAEQLTVSEQEKADRLETYKQQYAQQAQQFENEDTQREVVSRILTEKTVDLLAQLALEK